MHHILIILESKCAMYIMHDALQTHVIEWLLHKIARDNRHRLHHYSQGMGGGLYMHLTSRYGADTRRILTKDNHICHASSSTNRHHNRGLAWLDYEQHQISGAVSAAMYGVHMFSFVFMFQEYAARMFGISLACMHSYTAWSYAHNAVNIMLVHGPST